MRSRLRLPLAMALGLALTGLGCKTQQKWEYKVMSVLPGTLMDRTGRDAFKQTPVTPGEKELDELGNDGWELVGTYLEMETAYPNFGKEEYVTGLQTNVRPQRLVCIFKRPAQPKKKA